MRIALGLQALIEQEEPRALCVQCMAHFPNLGLQNMSEEVEMCRDLLGVIYQPVMFVTGSPKRLDIDIDIASR